MKKTRFVFILLLLSLFMGSVLFALDVPVSMIEDDSALRKALEASWFREVPGTVLARRSEVYTLRGGARIQVRAAVSSGNAEEFAVVLAREQNGAFSDWAQGTWVLIRRRDNDPAGSRIKVFLRSDYNTFVQFRYLSEEKCQMDVVLYDAYIIRSLPLPVPLEKLLVIPVEEALASAGRHFPRRYFDPDPAMYRDSRSFAAAVRSRLSGLRYVDDGAINENGEYVFIETLEVQEALTEGNEEAPGGLNCSGFAKWIVDGILRPVTGGRLPVAPLKAPFGQRGSSSVEHWEELRDQYFGLDWCRNLASIAGTVLRSQTFGSLEEIEVKDWPFSRIITRQGGRASAESYNGYMGVAGFGVEGLHPLLYTLAVDEPNRIYLAAVNNEIGAPVTPDNPRGLPRLRQFYHIAVLVPYFSENGTFNVAVFESAAETSFSGFKSRYPGQFVSLVRVPVEGKFDP